MNKIVPICIASGLLGFALPASAGDTDWYPAAAWEMNERIPQVLKDSTGNGFVGEIGDRVTLNKKYHSFPREKRDAFRPEHIDRVYYSPELNPGTADFAVSVRFRWPNKRHDMNLVQKGQGNPEGGLFKMKTSVGNQPDGAIKCLFRGSEGDSQVESYGYAALNDGKWHHVRCERTVAGSSMFIDGNFVDNNPKLVGDITNDWPITIGGNIKCSQYICNYWWGQIGYVRWLKD